MDLDSKNRKANQGHDRQGYRLGATPVGAWVVNPCIYCKQPAGPRRKVCADCKRIADRNRKRRKNGAREYPADTPCQCIFCGKLFLAKKRRPACVSCSWREIPPPDRPPPKPRRPEPACMRCAYRKEAPEFETGYVCLAECMIRCNPWAPGAKPLKERSDV